MTAQIRRCYLLDEFSFEPDTRSLLRQGQPVHLANKPFLVLLYLIENRDRLVSRTELLEQFWDGQDVYDDTLRKAVGAIRRALDDHRNQPRFIETCRAGGYRYIGPVEAIIDSEPAIIEIERTHAIGIIAHTEVASVSLTQAQRSRRALVLTAALVALVGLSVFLYRSSSGSPNAGAVQPIQPVRAIAILPLKNLTGDPDRDFLSDGLTDSLISILSKYHELKVVSRTSVFAFKNQDLDPKDIGQRLGVEGLLEGSLKRNGNRLRVEVRLVSTTDGRVLWAGESFERPLNDSFEIQDGVACAVGAELKVRLCGEGELNKSNTRNAEAYEAYLKGRYHWHRRSAAELKAAVSNFERALKLDPHYALAYAGLADTYAIMEVNSIVPPGTGAPKAKEYAHTALALDDTLAGPYAVLGMLIASTDWNWPESEKLYQKALARNPGYATAHHWYATELFARGRFAEAEAEFKRARELDPLAYGIANSMAEFYCYRRRYDQCLTAAEEARRLSPGSTNAAKLMGLAHWHKGLTAEARAAFAQLHYPYSLWSEALISPGTNEVRRKLEAAAHSDLGVGSPYFIAALFAQFGDQENAFTWLRRAYDAHQADLIMLKVDPSFDALRSDPRYRDLLRGVGLSE